LRQGARRRRLATIAAEPQGSSLAASRNRVPRAAKARAFLDKALAAPARPGRADEDAGRRREVESDLAQLGKK
jgi:hypothetical protein